MLRHASHSRRHQFARITSPARPASPVWLLLGVLLLVVGCGGGEEVKRDDTGTGTGPASFEDEGPREPRARYGTLERDGFGMEVVGFDLNRDGADDQLHIYDGSTLVRIERDLNFDGLVDAYEYYRDGNLFEEELDLDLDGQIDVVKLYEGGRVRAKRYATGFRADLVITRKYDAEGNLILVEIDTDADNVVDTWQHYKPGSDEPHKVEVDTDGDGKPDDSYEEGS